MITTCGLYPWLFVSICNYGCLFEASVLCLINVRKNRRGNQERTTQRHCQYWANKTQDESKENKTNTENWKYEQHGPHQKTDGEITFSLKVNSFCLL